MVDIGAGSLQISIYEKKALATTQNIRLGMAKIGEMFSAFSWEYPVVELVLKEMIDNDVQTFEKMFLKDHTIRSLILVGDTLISQIRKVLEHTGDPGITAEDIRNLYSQIRGKSTSEISQMLDMPFEYAAMVLPVMISLFSCIGMHYKLVQFQRINEKLGNGTWMDYWMYFIQGGKQ